MTNIIEDILFKKAPLSKNLLIIELPTIIDINVYQKKSIIDAMLASKNLSNRLSSFVIN